jgi:hypothetical protein
MRKEAEILKCKKCGDNACICFDSDYGESGNEIIETRRWAAHCMTCDNCIGHRGYYDPCAATEDEAIERWNELNKPIEEEIK